MVLRKQTGFGIIEVMIVLAVSGLLATLGFSGQREVRARAQFTSGLESVSTKLVGLRNQVYSTVSNGPGTAVSGKVVYGVMACFTPNSGNYTVYNLTQNIDTADTPAINGSGSTNIIPWGVTSTGSSDYKAVIFARDQNSGRLQTFTWSGTDSDCQGALNSLPTSSIDLDFKDSSNHEGKVQVDPTAGTINRSYSN